MSIKEVSIQLYTARKFQPYEDILKFFSDLGIKNIELFGADEFNEIEIKDLLDKYNLRALSTHISFAGIKDTEIAIRKLKKLNIKHAIVPAPDLSGNINWGDNFNKSEQEWLQFGKELSSYVKIFEDNGLTLGYHNHSFEFNKLPSGKMPIECMLDYNENLKFEIDIGWTVAGKADPIKWINKYAEKIIACHLKDFFSKDQNLLNHDQQSAIGEGFINWPLILSEIYKTKCEVFALEHDDPSDYKDFTLKSLKYLKNI